MNLYIELIQTKCSDFRFNLPTVKTDNTYNGGISSAGVSVSNLFRFIETRRDAKKIREPKKMVIFKLLFLSYIPTTLYLYHANSIAMLYTVHKYKNVRIYKCGRDALINSDMVIQ